MEKNLIITGANRGIGLEIVKKFAESGWNIWACLRRSSDEWEKVKKVMEHDNNIWIREIILDLNDEQSIKSACKNIFSDHKEISCLVNNAGISSTSLFLSTPVSDMKQIFEVDLFGTLSFTQLIARRMIRNKIDNMSIVNVASIRGLKPEAGSVSYGAAKMALIYATKVLAQEFGRYNIRVNAVAPGLIDTEMIEYKSDELTDRIIAESSLQRRGTKREVANAIYYLASSDASFITGEIMKVDGGYMVG